MKFLNFSTKLFGENIFILFDETSREAAIIDPGMMEVGEFSQLEEMVSQEGLHVKYVLLTHAHIDHACAAKWAADKYGAHIFGSTADQMYASSMKEQAQLFHLPSRPDTLRVDSCFIFRKMASLLWAIPFLMAVWAEQICPGAILTRSPKASAPKSTPFPPTLSFTRATDPPPQSSKRRISTLTCDFWGLNHSHDLIHTKIIC